MQQITLLRVQGLQNPWHLWHCGESHFPQHFDLLVAPMPTTSREGQEGIEQRNHEALRVWSNWLQLDKPTRRFCWWPVCLLIFFQILKNPLRAKLTFHYPPVQIVCVRTEDVAWWLWGRTRLRCSFCFVKSTGVYRRQASSYHSLHKVQLFKIR